MKRLRSTIDTGGEVLVAIMNNLLDFVIARDQHWYRIPVRSVENLLKERWPPQWLAFYQTKVFGSEAYAVNYYTRIPDIRKVFRWQLFPDQPHDQRGNNGITNCGCRRCGGYPDLFSAGVGDALSSSQPPGRSL